MKSASSVVKVAIPLPHRQSVSFKSAIFLGLVVLGLVAELIVRHYVPDGIVPKGKYSNKEFRLQVEQFEHIANDVNLLITGSSLAATNINTTALDQTLRKSTSSEFTTFNGGIRGCNFVCIDAAVLRHYLSVTTPNNVLVVVSPVDLDSQNEVVMQRSIDFVEHDKSSGAIGYAEHFAASVSYVYGFKGEIWHFLRTGDWPFDQHHVRRRGYVDMGYKPTGVRTENPQLTMSSAVTEAFRHYISTLSDAGTNVVLIPFEGSSSSRKNVSSTSRQVLAKLLDQMSMKKNVSVLRPTHEMKDGYYLDSLHLNSSGARVNAELLAERLIEEGSLRL